jgi:hypothetical protein
MLAVCTKPRMKLSRKMHNSHSQLLLMKLIELNTGLSKEMNDSALSVRLNYGVLRQHHLPRTKFKVQPLHVTKTSRYKIPGATAHTGKSVHIEYLV